jgi:hypothetical protein
LEQPPACLKDPPIGLLFDGGQQHGANIAADKAAVKELKGIGS